MVKRPTICWMFFAAIFSLFSLNQNVLPAAEASKPNIVVIYIDDMGYADIGPFGAKGYATPELDRMAKEGMRLTDFVVSSAVCSASRSALMTGCYHPRVGLHGALGPNSKIGLNPEEVTVAEICRSQGYATACFGKWHLGDAEKFLPLQQGFDQYVGLPYSNDMWPFHPTNAKAYPPLPLMRGNEVIDEEVTAKEQKDLTKTCTREAVAFIEQNSNKPFFLYVPHAMVHVPIFTSQEFDGKTGAGQFADTVAEVDWSVGQILATLRRLNLDRKTLVLFTSDNGPWLSYGSHAGSAGPLREGKGTMFEGGYRVPAVAWWPGVVPASTTCDELAATIDVLPTVAKLVGAPLPEHKIDGHDIMPLLRGEVDVHSPHQVYYGYYSGELQIIRDRQWKLVFPHTYRSLNGKPGGRDGTPADYVALKAEKALYDLKSDLGETKNVIADHPEIVARLEAAAEVARTDLGDGLMKRKGTGVRPVGTR